MMNLTWLLLFVSIAPAVVASPLTVENKAALVTTAVSILAATQPSIVGITDPEDKSIDFDRSKPIKRKRKYVQDVFEELGPVHQRRAHRMNEESFWKLHRSLKPYMKCGHLRKKDLSDRRNEKNGAVNGIISSSARLCCALRFFAGGDPLDICIAFGMSHTEVYNSVWHVVDAVHLCPSLDIKFPTCHQEQLKIAQGFKDRSKAGFNCCVGAIDGILIWTEKPTLREAKLAKCSQKKFLCGRKSKFGLNMQATCDSEGRFLDIDISHPGSTSDFLAFATCRLKTLLETPGFLAPGLCLFGDAAHPNRHHLVIPYKAVRSGSKDDFNFYHSQVRIKIECAFGMLVNRWAILRKPICGTIPLSKVSAMVMALCKLHNFCINERIRQKEEGSNEGDDDCPPSLATDHFNVQLGGGIPLERVEGNDLSPEQLLHGGEHFDDVDRNTRRAGDRAARNAGRLPQDILHDMVVNQSLARPIPNRWRE